MSVQIVMPSAVEMLLPKAESNEKRSTAFDPVDIEHEEVLAGLQNQRKTPKINSTKI